MPRPEPSNVHYIPVGKFGVVAHNDSKFSMQGWTRRQGATHVLTGPCRRWNGIEFRLEYHIPHGTFVMVLGPPLQSEENLDCYYYHILWGEIECWIRTDFVLNPYFNEPRDES